MGVAIMSTIGLCSILMVGMVCACVRMMGLCSRDEEKFSVSKEITIGECEKLFLENGYRTVIENGEIVKFVDEE